MHAYKKLLQSLVPCITTDLYEEVGETLGLEYKALPLKYEQVARPSPQSLENAPLPSLPAMPTLPAVRSADKEAQERLQLFLNSGLARMNQIEASGAEKLKSMAAEPVDVTGWRQHAFLVSDLPADYETLSHNERLAQRWRDVKEKQTLDEDEENEIEVQERYLSSQLNSWRSLRVLTFSGVPPDLTFPTPQSAGGDKNVSVFFSMYSSSAD